METFYNKESVKEFLEEFNDRCQEQREQIGTNRTEERQIDLIQKCLILASNLIDEIDKYWGDASTVSDEEFEENCNKVIVDFNEAYEQTTRKDKKVVL